MTRPVRVLLTDDEELYAESLAKVLRRRGMEIRTARDGFEALSLISAEEYDVIVLDMRMPGMDGLELQRKIKEIHPNATIIIMTAYASVETAVEAMKQGAYDYVVKPFDPDDLEHLIRKESFF